MAEPMYRHIAEDLRGKIESGELGGGARLPTEIELRETYGASRNTVRDAIKWLSALGLAETRPGQGTFVTMPIVPYVNIIGSGVDDDARFLAEVSSQGKLPHLSEERAEVYEAGRTVASELGIAEGSDVVARYQERFIDGTPWSMRAALYPISLVDRGATELLQPGRLPDEPAPYLARTVGIIQASWSDKLAVRQPDDNEATFFVLPEGGRVAVIDISRTSYDEAGTPFRLTITTYPADRNVFQRTLGKVPAVSAL